MNIVTMTSKTEDQKKACETYLKQVTRDYQELKNTKSYEAASASAEGIFRALAWLEKDAVQAAEYLQKAAQLSKKALDSVNTAKADYRDLTIRTALLCWKAGQSEEAQTTLEQLHEMPQDDDDYNYTLGPQAALIYFLIGNSQKARQIWEELKLVSKVGNPQEYKAVLLTGLINSDYSHFQKSRDLLFTELDKNGQLPWYPQVFDLYVLELFDEYLHKL